MTATPEQTAILAALDGPLRIAAGAGTGKTDTLRRAIVELVGRGAAPAEILCLTFTVEATKEMRRRVLAEFAGRTDLDADEITVQTYHAFAATIVRENALLAGLDGDPALVDQAQKWQLFLEALERCTFDELELNWLPTFIGHLLTLHDDVQRHDLSPGQVADWCRALPGDEVARQRLEALAAVEAYAALKRERNAIDFGDQITLALELLRTHAPLLERLRRRYRYVFLDEYQDTDVAQRELVKLVGTEAELVAAVGDVDQGIFGWRGATIHNMFAFPDDFPGARTLPLSVNFRSGRRILDLANAIIGRWQPPEGYTRTPLAPADEARPATVEAFVAEHTDDEAEGIAARIAESGTPRGEIAVLVRKRSQLDALFRALSARGIPVEVDMLGGFWMRPEILDVQAWLRLLADPADNIALARILLGPAHHLGRRDLYVLADHAKGANRDQRRERYGNRLVLPYSLVDAVASRDRLEGLSEDARGRLADFHATWRELDRTAQRVSLADLVGEIVRVSGLDAELAASRDPEADLALRHLAKLRDLAAAYEPVAGSRDVAGFVAYLDSIDKSDADEDELRAVDPNAVRLMTIYRAKGLEWDTVYLPGLSEGVLPNPPKRDNNPATKWWRVPFTLRGDRNFLPDETDEGLAELKEEEERRLMYVAITRAKRRLVLSRAWFYWGNKNAKAPSPFWAEALDTGLVALRGDVPCPADNPHADSGSPTAVERAREEPPAASPEELERLEGELERLHVAEAERPRAAAWTLPTTLSVTAFLTFVRDEDEFFWRHIRRIPSPPSPAAQLGTEIHRRIEEWSGGGELTEPAESDEERYDLDPGERRGDGDGEGAVTAEQLWENFRRSRFASMKPLMTEAPFTLYVGEGVSVTGRIDAIFEAKDGTWEVIDYKTGRSDPDPLQLALYKRAVEEIWGRQARCAWLLLRDGREVPAPPVDWSPVDLVALRLRNPEWS